MNSTPKILLIDDDPLIAQLVGMIVAAFQEDAYGLEHAPDYAGGLKKLRAGTCAIYLLD